jgi:hypothetical protein
MTLNLDDMRLVYAALRPSHVDGHMELSLRIASELLHVIDPESAEWHDVMRRRAKERRWLEEDRRDNGRCIECGEPAYSSSALCRNCWDGYDENIGESK